MEKEYHHEYAAMVFRHKNFVREKLLQTKIILHPLFSCKKEVWEFS